MSYSIGDGMVALALAGGIVGYLYLRNQSRLKSLEVIHQERLVAMEKGIPLPEFPLEPTRARSESDQTVVPILGIVLFTLSMGLMVSLYVRFSGSSQSLWISPLPLAFLGVGLIAFHFLKGEARR